MISLLKEKYGFKKIVMIGDGATDLEACPPAVSARHIFPRPFPRLLSSISFCVWHFKGNE